MGSEKRIENREQREARVENGRCPECGGELDTGWECNDCGFDARPEVRPEPHIEAGFEGYANAVFGGICSLSPLQQQELRRAFFAGAWHALCATKHDDSITNKRPVLTFECEQFVRRMTAGS